ncbi:MAG TPA: DUF4342 domain-containing protein [Fimbriimonas sp.]|nr:DUF4342 domain-containing protein [Fimbriimonas sp.]
MAEENKCWTEEFKVSGGQLLDELKKIVHEGNVRHIVVKKENGEKVIEIPVTVGVVGAFFLPFWAAVAAVVTLAANYTIEVVREEEPVKPE